MSGYRISELAGRSGFSASTLRYYEQLGLLSAQRTPAGYRIYADREIIRLRFIARAKRLGLPLDEIRQLVQVWDGGLCSSVKARLDVLLIARCNEIAARISELTAFDEQIARARADLAAPTPDGACDDNCGCTSDRPTAVELPNPRLRAPDQAHGAAESDGDVPIACTLTADGQVTRREEWAELLSHTLERAQVSGGVDLTFPADPDLVGRIAGLAASEQQCCAFFTFALDIATSGAILRVRAPRQAQSMLDELFTAR